MYKISKEILNSFQARMTKSQKTSFIEFYKRALKELNIEINIQKSPIIKSRNLIIGDIDKANLIFIAHYDTQPIRILPLPFVIFFPNNLVLSLLIEVLMLIVPLTLIAILGYIFKFNIGLFSNIFLILTFILSFTGIVNKHTANDNTSGVITINEMILSSNNMENIAYVLFDNEEKGLLGSRYFSKKYKDILNEKIIINLDCVSDGDNLMVLYSSNFSKNEILSENLNNIFNKPPVNKKVYIKK